MLKVYIEGIEPDRWVVHMIKSEDFGSTKQRLSRITNQYNIYGALELFYVDNEKDRISITSEEDWVLFLERNIDHLFAKVLLSPAELALTEIMAARVATPHFSSQPLVCSEPLVFGARGSLPYLETSGLQHITCNKPYLPHAPGTSFQKVRLDWATSAWPRAMSTRWAQCRPMAIAWLWST